MRIFFLAILSITFWSVAPPAFAQQARVALVIGNGTYEKVPELPNPTRDATDIGRALEVERSTKQEKISQSRVAKKESAAQPSRSSNVSGTNMEERYRACRKLVKGFAQRDACARNGAI